MCEQGKLKDVQQSAADDQSARDQESVVNAANEQRLKGEPVEGEPLDQAQPMSESQQALSQWLKQVPDDPGGLLRRKFNYQYSLRGEKTTEQQQW